jgi:catechol 2,3-dioxygenase-like lactoylglutathione lyase family enzyme
MEITSILHVSFLATDLERSRIFYETTLGLIPSSKRPDLGFPGVWYEIDQCQQIHLMQLHNPEVNLQRPLHGGRDRHVALSVNDLGELKQRLQAMDIPYTLSQSGRGALFCRDPEGNALEFIEVSGNLL